MSNFNPDISGLKPFKSGDEWNGNKDGRPKGSKNFSTIAKLLLEELDIQNGGEGEYANPLALQLIKIIQNDESSGIDKIRAINTFLDRIEGKTEQIKIDNNEINVVGFDFTVVGN